VQAQEAEDLIQWGEGDDIFETEFSLGVAVYLSCVRKMGTRLAQRIPGFPRFNFVDNIEGFCDCRMRAREKAQIREQRLKRINGVVL
jgi:hypothetical protein